MSTIASLVQVRKPVGCVSLLHMTSSTSWPNIQLEVLFYKILTKSHISTHKLTLHTFYKRKIKYFRTINMSRAIAKKEAQQQQLQEQQQYARDVETQEHHASANASVGLILYL